MVEPESASPTIDAPRILLVEDSPGEAELFCQAVVSNWREGKTRNHERYPKIDVAYSATSALDVLRMQAEMRATALPSLVVLDLDLPGGTGLTFLREIRRDSRLFNLPVIGLIWSEDESLIQSLDGFGLLAYEIKPLFFADLLTLVDRVCGHCSPLNPSRELEDRTVGYAHDDGASGLSAGTRSRPDTVE